MSWPLGDVLPASLRAEVADEVTGPEQRPRVGTERRQEDGRSLHVALQSHEADGDVHGGDVVGIALQGHKIYLTLALFGLVLALQE